MKTVCENIFSLVDNKILEVYGVDVKNGKVILDIENP
jgi:hypothetical protein